MKKITLLLLFLFLSVCSYSQVVMPTEGFDATSGISGPLPATWSLGFGDWKVFENNSGTSIPTTQYWGINAFAQDLWHSQSQCASVSRENMGAGSVSEDYLVTPPMTINANGVNELHFWTRMFTSGNQGTVYRVMWASAANSPTDPASFIPLEEWSELNLITPTTNFNVWTEKTVQLPTILNGQDIYLAFVRVHNQVTGGLEGDRWLIDDVGVASQCTAPTNPTIVAGSITSQGATLNWANPGGATSWEIEVVPAAGTATGNPTHFYTGAPPFVLTGMLPNTAYKFYVRAVCSDSGFSSPWSAASANFTTQVAPPVCGGNLVDSGGVSGNYGNNENLTTVVNPVNAGDLVTVTFTFFNTQTGDILKIYDGNSASAPLIASLSGTNLPPSYTSSSISGSLTFVFTSNGSGVSGGYVANITCAPAPLCRIPSTVSVSAASITTTSAQINWTQPANPDASVASTWDFYAVPCGSPAPTASSTPTHPGVTGLSGPIYSYVLGSLTPALCHDVYMRAVCSNNSGWTQVPVSFTTLVAPAVCGGNYVDTGGLSGNYANNENITTVITPATAGDAVTVNFTSFNVATGDSIKVYDGDSATGTTLLATLTGTTLPPSFISSHPSGALTFVFVSNGNTVAAGWVANITCAPKPACTAPVLFVATGTATHNSVPLSWTQGPNPDNSAQSWELAALPCGQTPNASTTWVPAATNPFTLTGLTSETCYDIYLRSACGSTFIGPVTITTLVAPPVCGGTFVDAGGTAGNYADNSNITTIICPNNPGDVVTVTFTEFNTEATWDGFYVYNGNSVVAANQISSGNPAGNGPMTTPGAFWGTTLPSCPFTSSAANGCLTFVFKSDAGGNRPGWVANVTCTAPATCAKPISLTAPAATVTYNSAVINWTQPANADATTATAWQIIKLPCGSPAPADTAIVPGTIDVTTAPPYVLTGLDPSTCYDIYVRAVCGTSTSVWSCPKLTITTPIAPAVCGGIFVDAGGPNANYPEATTDSVTTICPTNTGDTVTVTFTSFDTQATNDGLYVFDGNSITAPQLASTNGAGTVPGGLSGSYWGTLTGSALPGPFTSSSADGCLTFRFRTGAFTNAAGWLANVTCAPAPNCMKPLTPTATSITATSALLGWTEPSPNTVTQWEIIVLPAGSPAPLPSATGTIVGSNPALITGLLPATQYSFWVRGICPTSGTSLWSTAGNFLTLIINDNCDGAIFAPVNTSAICQQTTPGTITGATASTGVPAGCIGNANDDVWFQFIATNPYLTVALQNIVGSTQDLNFGVYAGACGGTFTQVFCSAANSLSGVVNGLTIGQTYFIRVYSNATAVQTATFNLCISTPSSCLSGQSACQGLTYQNIQGVTNQPAIGCLADPRNPTYYTINVSATGPINLLLTQSTTQGGAPNLDVDYAAWGPFTSQSAACAAIGNPVSLAPGIGVPVTITTGCSFSAASTENLNIANAVVGQVYVILITNYSNQQGWISLTQTNVTAPGAGTYDCCPDAYFKYTPTSYCRSASTPNPSPTADTGSQLGVFSSTITPGLVFVDSGTNTGSTTGQVNILASAPGNYLVTNTVAAAGACLGKDRSYSISIVEPTSATIDYGSNPKWCKNDTGLKPVFQTGTPNGTYSAIPNIGLSINPTTGEINPSLSSPGIYNVIYGLPGSVCTNGNPSAQVEIYPLPNIPYVAPIVACGTTTLPGLTVGDYFSSSQITGPATTPLDPIAAITSNQTVYNYAIDVNGCKNEKSFTVTINPKPVIAPAQVIKTDADCVNPGSIAVDGFPNTAASPAPNLFISEVTDATVGSLTYIEIYNGTGAPVNLTGYKLRTYNNGAPTFTAGCDNNLTGTLANNAVRVIAVGSNANAPGVTPNQTFAGCSGVNENDCIKLMTSANVVVDIWGRTDGIPFTPLNQPGYNYQRLGSAPHPSTTFNPSDWVVTDWTATTEDYSNVGSYSFLSSAYEFALDANAYIPSNTATGVLFTPVTPGNHTVTVRDVMTGCTSDPYPVTINLIGATPSDSDFTYGGVSPLTVCDLSTATLSPVPTNTTFTPGGQYVLDLSTPGLTVDINTGNIDLSDPAIVPGTYIINYTVGSLASCVEINTSSATVEITAAAAPVLGFSYNNNVALCPLGVTTLSPQLDLGFTTGGSFSISPATGGISVNASTGELTFASTVTPDTYIITYDRTAVTDDDINCLQGGGVSTANLVITAPTNANVSFGYPTTVCALANTLSPINVDPNLTPNGTFTISPTVAGVTINGSTGVVTFGNTSSGNFNVVYTVQQNTTTCQALTASAQIPFTITPATTPIVGFHYDSPVCAGDTGIMPLLDPGFVTGGTFGPSSLVDPATGEITGTLTAGQQYNITYHINAVPTSCQNQGDSNASISVTAPILVDISGECISNKFTLTANPVNGSFDPTQVTYEWTNSVGLPVGSGQTLIVTTTMGPGQYSVTVDQGGCSGSDSDTFNNVGCQIQKGISANNDTFNDVFDLTGFDVKQLTIFNRFGMKVYSRANYVKEWGGKSDDGDELPDGTYFYVIDTNAGKTETGWIYINRAQ